MKCVSTATFNVLWNGAKTEDFSPTRGVRQGDPLSPYLIVLCMERLSQLIENAVGKGEWKPVYASRGGPEISNLFFADDLMLFREVSVDHELIIRDILDTFCAASGQKLSLPKSMVFFSRNVDSREAQLISASLNIPATEDLGRYQGMPTINGRVTRHTFQHVIDRVDKRLAGWKARLLSPAGRATLVQSVISTIPCYAKQTAKLPRSICDEVDRKARKFIWGGSLEGRTIHNVSWLSSVGKLS